MFDQLKGMAGMAGLMKDLPKLKARMEEVKARLGTVRVEAETGGGAVQATVNGHLEVVALRVDPAMLAGLVDPSNPDDLTMAEALIVGAVNAAMVKARAEAGRAVSEAAAELGLPLPPEALEGLMS